MYVFSFICFLLLLMNHEYSPPFKMFSYSPPPMLTYSNMGKCQIWMNVILISKSNINSSASSFVFVFVFMKPNLRWSYIYICICIRITGKRVWISPYNMAHGLPITGKKQNKMRLFWQMKKQINDIRKWWDMRKCNVFGMEESDGEGGKIYYSQNSVILHSNSTSHHPSPSHYFLSFN